MCENRTLFTKFRNSLVNTKKRLGESLLSLFRGAKRIDGSLLKELEEKLLIADVGVCTTRKIIDQLVDRCSVTDVFNIDNGIHYVLQEEMLKILSCVEHPLVISQDKKLFVILVVGVNGVGKTSVVSKLAYRYCNEGRNVLVGAADTFRAAAVDQLKTLCMQISVPVVAPSSTTDPASVVFDAVQSAKLQCVDILIIDTAGRLQNKNYLMAELQKVVQVLKKFDVCFPHEVMIVLDSTIGQNSIHQVDLFNNCVGVTGITMSKLDSTAKGGVLFSIVDQFNIPIRYVSFGKEITDLHVFDIGQFVKSIF